MWNLKNNMLILLISIQKSYFCDNDAIYDVIMQEPVRKWCRNYRHRTSRDWYAELPLFKTFSIIFIFRQINRANFAVRGPSSLRPVEIWTIVVRDMTIIFPMNRGVYYSYCFMLRNLFILNKEIITNIRITILLWKKYMTQN